MKKSIDEVASKTKTTSITAAPLKVMKVKKMTEMKVMSGTGSGAFVAATPKFTMSAFKKIISAPQMTSISGTNKKKIVIKRAPPI